MAGGAPAAGRSRGSKALHLTFVGNVGMLWRNGGDAAGPVPAQEEYAMSELLERRYWPIIAILIFLNVLIFGCLILLIQGKIAL